MADATHEPLTIRGINWRETLPFTNLFRTFRVAIHPSKLVLALIALILMSIGGSILDGLWSVSSRAVPAEVSLYDSYLHQGKLGSTFEDYRQMARRPLEQAYADRLLSFGVTDDAKVAKQAAANAEKLKDLKAKILNERVTAVKTAGETLRDKTEAANKLPSADQRAALEAAKAAHAHAVEQAFHRANEEYRSALQIRNEGIFSAFFEYESYQVSNIVRSVMAWDWMSENHFSADPDAYPIGQAGVLQGITRFICIGPLWLVTQHPLYAILFGIYFLTIWAVFGGAIARIAAVHVARDEKLSIRSALQFSINKFLSFLFAPIIPLIIVAVVALLVAAVALLGNIPFLGPIIIGAFFFLALAAGFLMTLVLLGLVGGFNLMYPTVAVEGSDSFDAISRSFSYLYARPWRLAFYTTVALIYGAVTYLFIRSLIYVALVLTHRAVGMGFFVSADSGSPLWNALWTSPVRGGRLSYEIDALTLGGGQTVGAVLIWFWVYLLVGLLGAYAMSFYFSANSIIYYLMRREVDATELDDVYLEQVDEEFVEAPAAPDKSEPVATSNPSASVAPTTDFSDTSQSQPT